MDKVNRILTLAFGFAALALILNVVTNHPVGAAGPQSSGSNFASGSTPANPLFVRDADQQDDLHPFEGYCTATYSNGSSTTCGILTPPDAETVIQTITVQGNSDAFVKTLLLELTTVSANNSSQLSFATAVTDNGLSQPRVSDYEATFPTTIRVDPNTAITFIWTDAGPPNTSGNLGAYVNLQGYSVPLP